MKKTAFITWFSEIRKNDVLTAGGKGASLGEMTNAGIPIPPGFVIVAETFDTFLHEADIYSEIDAILHKVDHRAMHTVEQASEEIKALILSAETPKGLTQEIRTAFKKLDSQFVAVRSSATAEDSSAAAWAGQLESYLNTTEKSLLENVKKCWASLFTPRAIFYRFEQNLHEQHLSVAVVVQKMVESEVSGIAFSVHPVTQDQNQLIIEAGLGLGEAIVSGQITPDSYILEKENWMIVEKNVSAQTKALYRNKIGGNEWKEISGNAQKLSDNQIVELAKLIVKIEQHYGFPVDVEWAFEKGSFYIVQSRPITTLRSSNLAIEQKWPLNGEIFHWGPIPGRFVWPGGEFIDLCSKLAAQRFGGLRWPTTLLLFKGKRMLWLNEWPALRSYGKNIFRRYMLPAASWNKLNAEWKTVLGKLLFFEQKIDPHSVRGISNDTLLKQWNAFHDFLKEFWILTLPMELGNYGAPDLLQEQLKRFVNNEKGLMEAMETLTAPEKLSFYQQEEIDLVKTKDVKKHQQRYFWLKNSYVGVQILDLKFFAERKQKLSSRLEKELVENIQKTIQRKKDLAKKYKLPASVLHLAQVISKNVAWQDERKKYIFQNLHTKHVLLQEVSKRCSYDYDDLVNCWYTEIAEIIQGKDLHQMLLGRREKWGIYVGDNIKILSASEAAQYWEHYAEEKVEAVDSFSGTIACSGKEQKVQGKVRILMDPYELDSFKEGEILVAPMTSPEYIFAMKKAKAIITDTGGLTSHAAIVSRELRIPCLVGTKIATKVLKDGDLIELDANQGIVTIKRKR